MSRKSEPKPWPLRWIVLAIVISIGGYTYLSLHFRKTGHTFTPYQDLSKRATVERLLQSGWQRIPLPAHRPADSSALGSSLRVGMAKIETTAGGLPAELNTAIVEDTVLAADITQASASASCDHEREYTVAFNCTLADQKHQILEVRLYLKDQTAVLVPTFELITGELLARNKDSTVEFTVPPHAFKPGIYHVAMVGAKSSKSWDLDVR